MGALSSAIFWYGPFFGSIFHALLQDDFENVSHYIILTVLNVSLTASFIIAVVLLLRLALRKAPGVFSYALWAIVLVRLLCPVSVTSDFSLLNTLDVPASERGMVEYVDLETLEVELPIEAVSDAINERTTNPATGSVYRDAYEFEMSLGCIIWTLGVRVMGIYGIVSYILLRRKLIGAVKLRDNIYIADGISTPFVTGLFRPKIYLPSTLSRRETDYIILHEQHHVRRGDHVTKLLAFMALALHWFNPLVWLAFVLSGKDMEMSCDEAVTKDFDSDARADYSESLLRLATDRRIIAGTPLAFGEGKVSGRIKNLLNYRKPTFWAVAGAIVLLAVSALTLLTNPTERRGTELRSGIYVGGQQVYGAVRNEDNHLDETYCVTDSGHLFKMKESGQWEYMGELVDYPLSNSELDRYCSNPDGWTSSDNIGIITDCKQLRTKNDNFILLFQTIKGDSYLAVGWEDLDERSDSASDDTWINNVFTITHNGQTTAPELPDTVANPITSFGSVSGLRCSRAYWPIDGDSTPFVLLADNYRRSYSDNSAHLLTVPISNEEELDAFIKTLEQYTDIKNSDGVSKNLYRVLNDYRSRLDSTGLLVCRIGEYSGDVTHRVGPVRAENGTLIAEVIRESAAGTEEVDIHEYVLVIEIPRHYFDACHSYDVILSR